MKPLPRPYTRSRSAIRSTIFELKLHWHDLVVLELLAIVVGDSLNVTGSTSSDLQFSEQ